MSLLAAESAKWINLPATMFWRMALGPWRSATPLSTTPSTSSGVLMMAVLRAKGCTEATWG